ncbi:hypothetical protein IW967_11485 [Alicyclobacillus mali]|uniref:DUF3467 domain-containing protein n=1 Tax=Alicyclobacillus mali (ex Roth et al. 2021) TaxID=1123961 RepID=A0ABS0F592_9BACL|nr:hypothetical protein [Alicyclobacillus mali (ex Roth et al. 2021)]MBF8378476.1 hypothetical protein [Alicyclobacillus mali (ex Roth et al. 2021)]
MDLNNKHYVNSIGVRGSGLDIMIFASLLSKPALLKDPDQAQIQLYMSPITAKSLYLHLKQSIDYYEQLFGEIKLQPNEEALEKLHDRVSIVNDNED